MWYFLTFHTWQIRYSPYFGEVECKGKKEKDFSRVKTDCVTESVLLEIQCPGSVASQKIVLVRQEEVPGVEGQQQG